MQRLVTTDWVPVDLGCPSLFFQSQGLGPRDLLQLLEEEETGEGSCLEQLGVCGLAPLGLSALFRALCSLPLHCALSLSQPASPPLSG